MDPLAPTPTPTPPAEPAAPKSFLEAIAAAQAGQAQAATEPTPASTPAPAASTPPTDTPPPAAPAATTWVQELGDYKTPDEVKAALASLDGLRTNQLTDDQRAVLRLSEDPAAWREFNELTHMGDLKEVPDEEVLFRAFLRERPGTDPDDARFLFEQEQDRKYPGLAEEADTRAHKAHAGERKREAEQLRTTMSQQRDARLAELKKGALPAAGPTPEQDDAKRAAYLQGIDKLLGEHATGYKMTVPVGDSTLNLAVEPKDLPAFKAIIEDPMRALASEDGKFLDPQKLMRFAAFMTQGDALLVDAFKAGETSKGPQVSVAELHNADGVALPPAAGGDGSFLAALHAATPAQPKVKY